jgi:energy-coupling factor transport system permease protein
MADSEHSLQYKEHGSILHRIYPLTKLAWVFVVAIGLFVYRLPRSGAVMFGTVLLLALVAGRISLKTIVGSAKLIFGIGILLMFFHFVADPGEPVLRVGPFTVTDGGLREGPLYFFRLSVVVLASFVLVWTTHPRDLMVSLAQVGIPYRYAFAVFLTMRFLPLVQREVDAVQAAHAVRGRASRTGLGHRFRLWQRYVFTVLVNGLRKAETTATALECRAFGAYPDRTNVKNVHFRPQELSLVAFFVLLTAGLILWERLR